MRWKLLRRRLSVSAPRMIVRSHLPWPLRWAVLALMLGFSAAIALWAFEFGKTIAGLDRDLQAELERTRAELATLKSEHERVRQVADSADSLLKAERATQAQLAQQLKAAEADKLALQADLGFFERLLPTGGEGLQLRGLQAQVQAAGQVRYQMLVVQNGKSTEAFKGRYELVLSGQLDGKPWSQAQRGGPQLLQLRQYARLEGLIDHPEGAVIKALQARVLDDKGVTRATQTIRL